MARVLAVLAGLVLIAVAVSLFVLPVVADSNGTAGEGGGGGAVPTFRCGWGLLTKDPGDSFVAKQLCDAARGVRITQVGVLTVSGLVLLLAPTLLADRLRLFSGGQSSVGAQRATDTEPDSD